MPIEENANSNWSPIDFTVYFSAVKWPVILALSLEIIFRLLVNRWSGGLLVERQEGIAWFIRSLAGIFLIWQLIKIFGYSPSVTVLAGAIAGFLVGFSIAFFRLLTGFQLWKIFNLITETTIITLISVLILTTVVYFLSLKFN